MRPIYERSTEYWSRDLSDRSFEQAVMAGLDALGWEFQDNTEHHERPDLYIYRNAGRKRIRVALELKEKRQRYRVRWAELAGLPESELLVLDEVSARKLLGYSPWALLLFHDVNHPERPYVLFSIIDLFCAPKVRVQRPIARNTERVKAKWLLDRRHGQSFADLNAVFAAVANYTSHSMLRDLKRLEPHGPFDGENVETL